jgi:hypothetical protein
MQIEELKHCPFAEVIILLRYTPKFILKIILPLNLHYYIAFTLNAEASLLVWFILYSYVYPKLNI